MNEGARKKILYLALVAAIVWGWWNLSRPPQTPKVAAPRTIQPITAVTPATRAGGPADLTPIEMAPWGEDPFRPVSVRKQSDAKPIWIVTGIVFNAASPVAYVNKTSVRTGDTIDGATVVRIDKRSVTLDYGGTQFEISLPRG